MDAAKGVNKPNILVRILKLLSLPVTTILWRLPMLVLVRLPKRLLRLISDPKNRMSVFIAIMVTALVFIARRLIEKAVEKRNRI